MSQLRTFCALAAAPAACRLLRRTLHAAGGGVAPVKNGIVAVLSACAVVAVVAVQSIAFTPDARAQTSNPCSAGQGVFPDGQCYTCPPVYENSATLTADGFCTCPEGKDFIDILGNVGNSTCVSQNLADAFNQCRASGYLPSYFDEDVPGRNYCEVPIRNVSQSRNLLACYLDDSSDTISPHCTAVFGPDLVIPQKPTDGSAPRYVFNCDPDGDNGLIPATINTIGATECACPAGKTIRNGVCVAASAEVCGELTPAQFYDAAAGACVLFVTCGPGEVLYPETNDCHAPSDYPLIDAIRAGDLDLVNHFITVHMLDVNGKNNFLWAPLHYAASHGNVPIVAALIAAGAIVDVRNDSNATPLHRAVNAQHISVVATLLAEGADVNARNYNRMTPLSFTSGNLDSAAIVALLIAAGGHWGTDCASIGEAVNPVNAVPPCLDLHQAAAGGHVSAVATLLATGATLDARDGDDNTPLHLSADGGHAAVVSLLIQATASLNVKNNDDDTPLHLSADGGHTAVVSLLIQATASLNVKNNDNDTPLHLAVGGGHAAIVALLIEAGAYWGDAACGSGEATNPAGATPPCVCEPPTVGTAGNCAAPSKESCGGLTPAQFYDAAAGACVPVVTCGSGEVLYPEANDCHAPNSNPLRAAVFAGDLDLVKHFITAHMADVNRASSSGVTPLHYAANGGHAAIASVLIAAGADVNAKNDEGETPLRWAAGGDYVTVVVLLLEAGADVDGRNDDDETPLHWAARNGRVAPVDALIAGGADVDAQDKDGDTPLHFAARFDRVAIVSLLIQATASLNVKNKDDKAPLHWAAEVGYPAVVSALIAEGADVNVRDKDDKGPLHLADAGGYADIVALLIEAGAYWGDAACESGEVTNPAGAAPPCLCESNAGTSGNCFAASKEICGGLDPAQFYDAAADVCVPIVECAPPKVWHPGGNDCHVTSDYSLFDAVFAGDLDLVNHFITVHMADVNRRNGFQFTPLHLAAEGGHAAIVSVLIAAGADVNAKPANGNDFTPLRRAVAAGYATIIVLLIAAGADVDGSNQFGETSLHEAARDGRVAAVDALIAGGADVDAKDRDDATPLHFAASYGASGRVAIVSLLIQATASLNVKNEDGKAPLHLAAQSGYAAVVAALIAAGAYWGDAACESGLATNPAGATPPCINLHQAAAGGHVFAVATLIATGATLDARDGDNNTPLHLAARNGRAAIVSQLIQATASLNVKNEDGKAPLHLADAGGHADIVAALIEAGAYWGDAVCRSGEVTNSAGPSPACAACAAPSVARARTNLCDCSAPNVGMDGAAAPGNCACPAGQPALYLGVCVASCPDEWMLDSGGTCVPSPAVKSAADATLLAEVQKSSADVSVVLRALDEGADANTATSAGIPVLVVAATMLHAEVVGILITAGADPTVKVKVDGPSGHRYLSPDSRFIPEALLHLSILDFVPQRCQARHRNATVGHVDPFWRGRGRPL